MNNDGFAPLSFWIPSLTKKQILAIEQKFGTLKKLKVLRINPMWTQIFQEDFTNMFVYNDQVTEDELIKLEQDSQSYE